MKPYKEEKKEDHYIRKFSSNLDELELKWHWDEQDRIVTPLNENDWYFQKENELPMSLEKDVEIKIKKGEWHRVIKGSTNLVVKIIKS